MAVKNKKIFDKEIYKLVNEESIEVLEDYKLEMQSEGKSDGTIYQYTADIKMFYCWSYEKLQNKSILKMSRRDFRRFFLIMQKAELSSSRINRVQCSLRNLLEYIHNDDEEYEYDRNMMQAIKGLPKESVREIHFLTDAEIAYLIDYYIEKEDFQRALYISLSYDSAGRRNEVFQVNKTNFIESKQTNEVVGKRNKTFKLLYFNRTRRIAEMYFEQRGEDDIESLWLVNMNNNNKRQALQSTLYQWVVSMRKILEKATGEKTDFNPHTFRHSALENYSNGTHHTLKELGKDKLPIEVLKVLANHESVDTTQSYLMDRDQELLENAFGL